MTVMNVTIENGPLWLQYLVAFGTAGAAVFAGWAAWSARSSTNVTRKLVTLETQRDENAREGARWQQARRVAVDSGGQGVTLDDGSAAQDLFLHVINTSSDPIYHCRLKLALPTGEAAWGPQLVGTLAPGSSALLIARVRTTDQITAMVRFRDVQRRPWLAYVHAVEPDDEDNDIWVKEGAEFTARRDQLSVEERGTLDGGILSPDLDEWRAGRSAETTG